MLIKKSFFNRIMSIIQKSNNDNFESLKAEVLEVLKKQAKKENAEVNKALCEMESKTSYITKSVKGEIIQKSGYPVGTVREWKGKKYIKIAPKMWKRKYDKTDKGASISIGKLIKQVENCKDVESLMNLVLANKQRFTDENGNHLPIVDKLRAAVDKKNDSFDSETKIKTPKKKTPKTEDKQLSKDELKKVTSKFLGQGLYKDKTLEELQDLYDKELERMDNPKTKKDAMAKMAAITEEVNKKQKESEAEKHANRSEGMKGNQNAKKDGVSEEEIKEKFNNAKVFTEDEMSNFTEENYIKAFDFLNNKIKKAKYSTTADEFKNCYKTLMYGCKHKFPSLYEEKIKDIKEGDKMTYGGYVYNPNEYANIDYDYPKSNPENIKEKIEKLKNEQKAMDEYQVKHPEFFDKKNNMKNIINYKFDKENRNEIIKKLEEAIPISEKWNNKNLFNADKYKLSKNTFNEIENAFKNISNDELLKFLNNKSTVFMFPNSLKLSDETKKELRDKAREWRLKNSFGDDMADVFVDKLLRDYIHSKKESTTENKTLSDVRKKYETSKSVQGNKKTVTLPNGEKIKCHYKLVEADAPTASHDEKTFAQSDGFPTNKDGSTINDRDYSQDRDAQESVISIAQKYGSQALENPPIVTKDGIVLSGNNRTMSSKLAAKNGTDKAYLDDLKEQIDEFGIDEDELKGFKHPRIILEIDEEHKGDYTTQEMAKYNETGMKTQNTTEKAVKISKTLNQEAIADISSSLEGFETLGELYNDPSGVSDFISKLVANGVLNNQNKMDYVNNDNTLSDAGKEFIETVLCGTILNESNIRQMNTDGGKQIRKKLIRALMPLAQNKGNGNEYSISTELNEAVNIALQMSKKPKDYPTIDSYLQSIDMFNDKKIDDITAKFAEYVHGLGEKAFASKMQSLQAGLRESASGEQDFFFGGCESKDDVMKRIFEIKKSVQNAISSLCRMIF